MIKEVDTGIRVRPGVRLAAPAFALAAMLQMPSSLLADQLDPTITANYPADPGDEKVFTFIDDMTFSATTLHGYDVDTSQDGEASILICGTNSCTANGDITTRTFGGGSGYAEVTIFEEGPAGSGFIDPFLRQQHNEQTQTGNNTYETAYNTNDDDLQSISDGDPYDYENMAKDTNAGGGNTEDFNHAVLWNQQLADGETFQLKLDINESENTSEILLDEMSLWVSTSDSLNLYDPGCTYTKTAGTTGSHGCFDDTENPGQAIKVWDLDLDSLVAALMLDNSNDQGRAGSGDYDAIFTFETSLVNAAVAQLAAATGASDFYFFLENTMGLAEAVTETGDCEVKPNGDLFKCKGGEVDAGFEEWVLMSEPEIPVPGTALLLTIGGLALVRQRRLLQLAS